MFKHDPEKLARDFPEINAPISRKAAIYTIGEEPPAWKDWLDRSPLERLRHVEMLRRISYGYDPDAIVISRSARLIERRAD
ncbi:MAG: hypothetical protein AAF797_08250 [Planctomycetota bacterium]